MSNVFDKFDAPATANPFDQFDAPAAAPSDPKQFKPSKLDEVAGRFFAGVADPVYGAGQIMDKLLVNPIRQAISPGATSMTDVVKQREGEYVAPEGIDVARIAGNVANPLTWAGGVAAKALPKAHRLLSGVEAVSPVAGAVGTGAVQGALMPTADEDFARAKVQQAGLGAAAGAGGHALARAVGGIVKPTAQARELMDRGVALTPGQAGGVGSIAHGVEQYASSLPVASHFVRNAQRRGVEEANRAAAESVAGIVQKNVKLGLPPREAIEQTRDLVSKTYDDALEGMVAPSVAVESFMRRAALDVPSAHPLIPAKELRGINNFITQRLGDLTKNSGGMFDGPMLKQLDSEVGKRIRDLKTSTNAADKTAAPAWQDIQQALREAMEASTTSDKTAKLSSANAAYRQLLALEKSLLSGADTFTPRQLKRTLENRGIKGTELNKVAEAMSATLPNTVPTSGTAERLLMGSLPAMLMGGGAGAQQMGFDTLGTGMMAAGALGSRPGSKLLTGGYGWQQQQAILEALRRGLPAATRTPKDEK